MKYEYNGHLTFDERIKQVAKEITDKYNSITNDEALKIASLEGKIDTEKTYDMEFNRLYNILLILKTKKEIFQIVLNDFKELYLEHKDEDDEIKDDIFEQISLYELGKRKSFPIVSEFYNK